MLITSPKREPFFWLVHLSVLWSLSLGFLRPCEDSTKGLPNGTTVAAEIGRPVSVSFCVETDGTVNERVRIIEPNHQFGEYIRGTKNDIEKQNVVIHISLWKVEHRDLNVPFRVRIFTYIQESVDFSFIIQEKGKKGFAFTTSTASDQDNAVTGDFLSPQIATTESSTTSKTEVTTGTRLTSLSATESAEDNVGAIVGGITDGIVVIVLVAVVIYVARRKGMYNKCIKKESAAIHRYTGRDYEEKDSHYMNTDQPSSPYECSDDNLPDAANVAYMNNVPNKDTADVSYMNHVSTKETQTYSLYEEDRNVPDNSSSSGSTNMREALPYSAYTELEDGTPV